MQSINNSLAAVNKAVGGKPVSANNNYSSVNQSAGLAPISQAQVDKIQNSLNTHGKSAAINQAANEAAPTIMNIVKIESCASSLSASSRINVYGNNSYSAYDWPMGQMHYHDKGSCLSVLRFQNWSMPANNALKFEVVYVADDSGESRSVTYVMVKQPSGEWLLH